MVKKQNHSRTKPRASTGIEWFSGARSALSNTAISIAREGRLRCNAGFVHAHRLQPYTGVELGYDRARGRVLVRFGKLSKDAPGIRLREHDGGKVANAKSFFTQHGLDPRRYLRRYAATPVNGYGGPTFAITLETRASKRRS
jgi:hypothetical protein